MRLITIEEHYMSKTINKGYQAVAEETGQTIAPEKAQFVADYLANNSDISDISQGRINFMDQAGVDVQLLSYGNNSPMTLRGPQAIDLCREANDELAQACQHYSDRLYGLACLPLTDPQAASIELKRTVEELGFRGALIQGTFQGQFLDDPSFWPIFEQAEALEVPIQFHPGEVLPAVQATYYQGNFSDQVAMILAGHGIGWHYETGIHVLRLILSGVFDRYPRLQVILGHWGELLPYFIGRFDEMLPQTLTGLEQPISYYFKHNLYLTPSGMYDEAPMRLCLDTVGPERILWSMDFPYVKRLDSQEFLLVLGLDQHSLDLITHRNADELFKLADK